MQTATLAITGMSCGHCVRAVSDALGALPGVAVDRVTVGSAHLQYDPDVTSPATVAAAVRHAGYEATVQAPPAPRPAPDATATRTSAGCACCTTADAAPVPLLAARSA
jgi:Cu+-exporting ATPase